MRVFALSWAITGGGPARSSEVFQLYIYNHGMGRYLNIGYAMSLSITFSIIVFVCIILFTNVFRDKNVT